MNLKSAGLIMLALVLGVGTSFGATDDPPRGQNPLRKLSRGFANLICGVVELPNQVTQTTARDGGGAGVTYGVGKGFVRWFAREGVGIYEILTFPIPAPPEYRPIMKPEFPTEDYEP